MKKSSFYAVIFGVIVSTSLFLGVSVATPAAAQTDVFIYGVSAGPNDLDCHQMWDSASGDVADQVCEGLFAYNLTDPELAIIPRLAADDGVWNLEGTEFNVTLKTGVWFHDGTPFNAEAVKWNFDRLMALIDAGVSNIAELYVPLNGEPVINETVVIDSSHVSFKLNYAYVPFKALLCFTGGYMMSPSSTPLNDFLEVGTNVLVGTGPYVYTNYAEDESLTLDYWPYYHGGTPAIKHMVWQIIEDGTSRMNALLSEEIHMVDSPNPDVMATIQADPDLTLSLGPSRQIIQYIGMNNVRINQTWRQAISYAINYTYLIEEIMQDSVTRMKTPVPNGILYSNDTLNFATYNVTNARMILQAAGIGTGLSLVDDDAWISVANGSNPLFTANYTYNTDNTVRTQIGTLLADNLEYIGIKVVDNGVTWSQFLNYLYETEGKTHDMLSLYFVGWQPDYNDPSNFINPLFSNTSSSNSAQVNDPQLQAWMMEALTITDPVAREALYDQIQKRIIEEVMPWAFVYVGKGYDAWNNDLEGFPQNGMGKIWFFDCTWQDVDTVATFDTSDPPLNLKNQPAEEDDAIPGFAIGFVMLASIATVAVIMKKKRS